LCSARHWDELLLDRDRELASAESALVEAAAGAGSTLLIEGPAGIGKTRLAEAMAGLGQSLGFEVHRARGDDLERGFAYGVLRQLLSSMLESITPSDRESVLEGPARHAASVLDDVASEADPDSLAIDYGFYRLLHELAERSPRMVVIDDAHDADLRSLRALRFVARRLEEQSIVMVVMYRPSENGSWGGLVHPLSRFTKSSHFVLSPLGEGAISTLAEAALDVMPDEGFLGHLAHITGGNPFLVTEMLAMIQNDDSRVGLPDAPDLGTQVPDRVVQSLQQRINAVGEAAAKLTDALAVFGAATLRDVARLASLDETEAAVAADSLVVARVLTSGEELRFTHPLLRSAVASHIPPGQGSLAHARAGRILADVGAPLEEVAAHLMRSPARADPWVVETLVAAGRLELQRGSPETAEPLLARAAAEPPPPSERSEVTLALARARAQTGHPDAIATAHRAIELATDPGEKTAARIQLIRTIGLKGDFRSAVSLIEDQTSENALDSEMALQVEAELLGLARLNGDTHDYAVDRLDALTRHATPARRSTVVLLANLALSALEHNEDPSHIARWAELALTQGWLVAEDNLQVLYAVTTLIWIDRLDAAQHACDQMMEAAGQAGSVSRSALLHGLRSQLNLRRGLVPDAEADARICADLAFAEERSERTPFARAHLADALLERGEWTEAENVLAGPHPSERADLNPYYLNSRGWSCLALNDPAAALENFLACGRALSRRGGVDTPTMFPWRSHAARALLRLGDHQQARDLAVEELKLAEKGQIRGAIAEARTTLGVIEGGSAGEQHIRSALEILGDSPRMLTRIRVLTELGSMIRRQGRPKDARPFLRSALDLAHRHGALARAEQARDELTVAGAKPRRAALTGVDALTPSERRVVEMVGMGLSNREIADTLFVSPRTVSTHLTHIYQKLSPENRDELRTFAKSNL
jgi:DNA-binding CsgD family transcriptional regulator